MSDLEIIFPHVVVGYNALDLLKLTAMVTIATLAVLQKAYAEGSDSGGTFVMVVILLAVMKAYQTYSAMESAKQKTRDVMTRTLARQMLDSDKGVLLELLDSMEEQEVKEVILGYWALQTEARALTAEGADSKVEALLQDSFNSVCDFEISDSLRKLEENGMVTVSGIGENRLFKAAPIEEVLSKFTALAGRGGG